MKDMQDRIGDFQQTGGGPLADFSPISRLKLV